MASTPSGPVHYVKYDPKSGTQLDAHENGTTTLAFTGAIAVNLTFKWEVNNNIVFLNTPEIAAGNATGTAALSTAATLPKRIRPAANEKFIIYGTPNATPDSILLSVNAAGTISFNPVGDTFTTGEAVNVAKSTVSYSLV